ncbi:TIM barrel protein [Tenggerimyces flavus]|uniref:TIM barrel protein n=1 Tax=Tenggerimyces flavus TaxID=1708749 RepID=A0ABV7Y6K6_9ACTN|nr:TIM barrel protein [Tenggerimyces flavus]MBM7788670.1 inosose dehydratase [Tenggerimyces flavus]
MSFLSRVAGAPITWGVCEVPGWGVELPPSVVLSEMASLGLSATELGPTGYLGASPSDVRSALAAHGMSLVGGFLPVVLHASPSPDLSAAEAAIATLAGGGSEVVVLAADLGGSSYDARSELTDAEWSNLVSNIAAVSAIAESHGLRTTLHPHVGTAIESAASVTRLLDSSDVPLCLDTGHLAIGGTDPLALAQKAPERIGHVHLKDVNLTIAKSVAEGTTPFIDGVRAGMFTPLGEGDLDIAGIVSTLESAGYQGWYVLEQDTALTATPTSGTGPLADAHRSVTFLKSLAAA